MKSHRVWLLVLAAVSVAIVPAQTAQRQFEFEQFPATLYRGGIRIPHDQHKLPDGEWVDDDSRAASPPRVNFAGEYYLTARTCGTCCRYYVMTSMRTGRDVSQVSMFDTERLDKNGEEVDAQTRDGHTYVPVLYFRRDSNLVIVHYELDLCVPGARSTCRQRYFVFEDGKFRSISKTFPFCTKEGDEPE